MKWDVYLRGITMIGGRYFIVAGIAFLLFYVVLRNKQAYKKIQQRFPKNVDYFREIGYSVLTMLIFSFVAIQLLRNPNIVPYTRKYNTIAEYGWLYYFLAFPLLFIMHDAYFYFTHRLMHHKRLFKWFHLVHHQSTNPSPWAAYAFHPLEAVVEVGIVAVILFTVPVHYSHLLVFFLAMITYNVYGHLGYELYPKGFSKSSVGRWINTSVNHNMHHQYFKGNYGLYFLFWDRLLGTVRKDYDERFEEVKSRAKLANEEIEESGIPVFAEA